MSTAGLRVELFSFWQAGTGRGAGSHVDSVCHTDADGLPEIPGRTLKGLLRDAVRRAGQLRWFDDETLHRRLFGVRGIDGKGSEAGGLRVGSARLPKAERDWLAGPGAACVPELFRDLHATAIDPRTGTVRAKSLRGIQVAMPLVLQAELAQLAPLPEGWQGAFERSLALVRAVGTGRTRGLGRARLSLVEIADE